MTYKEAIIARNKNWEERTGYDTGVSNAINNPQEYKIYLDHEICKSYRLWTGDGLAFGKSFVNIPLLDDELPIITEETHGAEIYKRFKESGNRIYY